MADIYSTNDVATALSVSPTTIRTWKHRKADRLIEGEHWFNQENQLYWTEVGLTALQEIQSRNGSKSPSDAASESPSDADPFGRYSQLINAVASAVTPGLLQRIDNAVMQQVKGEIAKPMTSTECVTLLAELGLTPGDPSALLGGTNVAGLLEAKES